MSTYGVIGASLWGNRGAEAMIVTTIGRVRALDPSASFDIWSYQPAKDRSLLIDAAHSVRSAKPLRLAILHLPFAVVVGLLRLIRLRWPARLLPADVRALREERAIFDVTGISFHDGRLAVSIYNLVCLMPAILMGVPVIRLSQAMGPFRKRFNRWGARFALRYSTHTFARGESTAAFVTELDVARASWSIAPDVAFSYEDEFSLTVENEDKVAVVAREVADATARGTRTVALIPSSLVHKAMTARGEDPVAVLAEIASALVRAGYHVLVMPNATSEGSETLRNNDIVPIGLLRDRIRESDVAMLAHTSWVDFDVNTKSIRALVSRCDAVVTSRFHAMIASLALGIPVLVIGWSHKYDEVLATVDCRDDALDAVAARDIDQAVTRFVSDLEVRRAKIAAHIDSIKAESVAQFDLVATLPPPRRSVARD